MLKRLTFLLLIAASAFGQSVPLTSHYNLNLPPHLYNNQQITWDTLYNNNFSTIDGLLFQGLVNQISSDPSPCTGKIWYNTATSQYKTCIGGSPIALLNVPVSLVPALPVSQTNECSTITRDTSGGVITAVPVLRTIDSSNIGHDVMCVVTSDAGLPGNVGGIIFPFVTAISRTAGPSMAGAGVLEMAGTSPARLILTNTTGNSRANSINFRSAAGGSPNGGFGTDFRIIEDVAEIGNEDLTWIGPSQSVLYVTFNCPAGCATQFAPVNGTRQFLLDDGTHDAKTNPEFGLVNGHLAHGTSDSNLDNWGPLTLSGGTASRIFARPFTSAPLCGCNNPNQSGDAIACSASATTTTLTVKSGTGTDTINYWCNGHPY